MNYFFDTEFLETGGKGRTRIELISIGIVCEDGRELYLENKDFDWEQEMPDNWLHENVRPLLTGDHAAMSVDEMALAIKEFIDNEPTFWAYVGAYDYVALISLFGRLIDRPSTWPIWCRELKHLILDKKIDKEVLPKQVGAAHNALEDAKWNLEVYQYCMDN